MKKIGANHHTDDYKCIRKRVVEGKEEPAALVVRRGQVFLIMMTFDRDFDAKKHDLQLQFKTGLDPSALRGTDVTINIDEEGNKFDNSNKWQARVTSEMPAKTLKVEIFPPSNCIIGEWDLHVYTISKDKRGEKKKLHYKHDQDIFIIFNAWCKEDEVYFPEDPNFSTDVDPRDEYVLNPSGAVYRTKLRPKAWIFGQFDNDILQISLRLVTRYFDGVVDNKMGSAAYVSRAISSMVNFNDKGGVLYGRWDGLYADGDSPSSWSETPKILRQYRDEGPVKYGQCWVFSAITVTVCRALGIPCRSVTNYSSAHDVDGTCEIERVMADNGYDYETKEGDSVWNFHVWNEAWMKRNDFEKRIFDGWQIVDATPQEKSEGLFQCGPCPLRAVFMGLTYLPIDAGFVYAEVNSDIVYYQKKGYNAYKRVKTVKDDVGKNISTKKPDGDSLSNIGSQRWMQRLDVTKLYKHDEGTPEERIAAARARRFAGNVVEEVLQEVTITITQKKEETYLGEPIEFVTLVKNTSDDKKRRMKISSLTFRLSSIDYTGHKRVPIKSGEHKDFFLNPDEEKPFDMKFAWEDYNGKRQDSFDFSLTVVANVDKSGNSFPENKVVSLLNPAVLEIEADTQCKVGQSIEVKISVTNPLPITLTGCILKIADEKFDDHPEIKESDLKQNETLRRSFKLTANRKGKGLIIVTLDTKELPDIMEFKDVMIM
ncbi:protein-glutamine gamma-glutamyltransferase K-like [Pecten maximus]|uniref:protein-glutamine gamma-glutamyltransferase K-like n=1 Tax=Pecten maximus TaxID=6579 RepID=UPI0014587C65|nr:protein-glutamine gamma-glutamyltransferase K-like [Pecten maximus]